MCVNELNSSSHSSSCNSLISFMEHCHDHWFIKNDESKYIYMNNSALNYFNYPEKFNVEGRLDKEMPLESSQELWPELVTHDQKVIENDKCISAIEIHYYGPGNIDTPVPHLCSKSPLHDDDHNVIGVVCRGSALDAPALLYYMNRFDRKVIEIDAHNDIFTKRELEIAFWAQQKLTSKEIAKRLDISPRTIENHLQTMYQKIGVHTMTQFIDYCYATGLDKYIPSDFIRKGVQLLA